MDLKKIATEMQPKTMAARDWVFQVIRTAIVRGVLPGGMPLRQDEISSALSVSHIPVREAFRQLEAQGLVRIYPNRGAVVTKLSRIELDNVMDTRIMLELGVFEAALNNATPEDVAHTQEILDAFSNENNTDFFDELNLQFHLSLYAPSNNQIAISMIDQLHANADRYIHPYYPLAKDVGLKGIVEHQAMLDAYRDKNIELGKQILLKHLLSTKELLLNSPMLL